MVRYAAGEYNLIEDTKNGKKIRKKQEGGKNHLLVFYNKHVKLPDRGLNVARGRKPYEDYVPVFLWESFGDGMIWKNKIKNVYMCDCGCGFEDGRLGCLCLETKEETYVQ